MIKHENLKRFREHQQQLEDENYIPVFTSEDGGMFYAKRAEKNMFRYLHNDSTVDDWDTRWDLVFQELFEQRPELLDALLGAEIED